MSGESLVKIKVLWDSIEAKRSIVDFQNVSGQAQRKIAADARISADATFFQARALESLEKSALAVSRAQLANAQASAIVARASRITAESLGAEAAAAAKATAAFERKTAVQARAADRALVFADNRQNRDMSYMARDQEDVKGRRVQMASRVADGAMLGGAAVLGGLGYAAEQGAKFSDTLLMMRNNTTLTQKEFDTFKAHIMAMGASTGASMDQMAAAFMRAKNHGFDTAESIKVVDAATKSALGTGANIEEVANVLAQTMHIFHLSADQATNAMDTLHQAQLQGNTTMAEFVQSFGLAEAVTSKYGLTLQDTAAVTATMTENGLNMAEAGTQIRDVMQHLTNPLKASREAIEKFSKASGVDLVGDVKRLQAGTGSLTQAMIDLNRATEGHAVKINAVIPAQRGAFGAMALTGKAADDLKKNFSELNDTMSGKLHPSQDAFARQQEQLTTKQARLNNELIGFYVTLGTSVAPVLGKVVDQVAGLLNAFNSLSPATQRTIAEALGWLGALLLAGGTAVKVATGIVAIADALKLAGIGFTAAEGASGAAATGMLASFGMGAAVVVAIVALGVEIIALKNDWDDVKKAQDQAAGSLQRYTDQKKNLQGQGELGKLNVGMHDIADARAVLKDQIDAQKEQTLRIGQARRTGDTGLADNLKTDMLNDPAKFGDASAGGLLKMINRLAEMDRDYKTEAARQHELVKGGAGAANLALVGGATPGSRGAVPEYEKAMMADTGKVIGLQCGEAITHYLRGKGINTTATQADTAADRVRPDAQGNYPEGTIFRVGKRFHGQKSGADAYSRGHYEMLHYGPEGPATVEANYGIKDGVTTSRPFSMRREESEATWGGAVHAYLPTAAMARAWNEGQGKAGGGLTTNPYKGQL